MNKHEKEVIQAQLDSEKAVLKELEKQYQDALNDIIDKSKILQSNIDMLQDAGDAKSLSLAQSKIYQKQYQDALRGQIEGILDKLHSDEFGTVQDYLNGCYNDGFLGTMYDMAGQGVPVIAPIDQGAIAKAVQLDSKINGGLYASMGIDAKAMKKAITNEITRGIASGMSYNDIARNISNASKAPLANAKRIARTEGHRIQEAASDDARRAAKEKGADSVKMWSSALDGDTRPTHRKLDGQIREIDEPFEMDGKEAMFPGDFGDPAEDCNCRCKANTRAKWALDEYTLQKMKDRADFFGLDKSKGFEEFEKKYLKASETIEKSTKNGKIVSGAKGALTSKNDPDFVKRDTHAKKYYDSIRNANKESIINKIVENTGVSIVNVSKAINHLFYNKHDLDKGRVFFDPDYDIAESVRRLRTDDNIQPHDLILIQHESYESDLMKSGMKYEEAHEAAQEKYNYKESLIQFLKANNLE